MLYSDSTACHSARVMHADTTGMASSTSRSRCGNSTLVSASKAATKSARGSSADMAAYRRPAAPSAAAAGLITR